MTTFLQLHVLTSYPPANLNRDDTGRPKTAMVGRRERLRISSQALKRAWRTSAEFSDAVGDAKGVRTKRLGRELMMRAEEKVPDEKARKKIVSAIASQFGKLENDVDATTMVFLSSQERRAAEALLDEAVRTGKVPDEKALAGLVMTRPRAADIAMFGRMLAEAVEGNVDAAVQVAHAITVHEAVVEDDYFTAVDDLKKPNDRDDTGAAHIGEAGFGTGVFYLYVCINYDLLLENLGGDAEGHELAEKAIDGLVRAITTVSPSGKQASFASRARASYCLAELGGSQPRSLSVAFLSPVNGPAPKDTRSSSILIDAVTELAGVRRDFSAIYGDDDATTYEMVAGHAIGDGESKGTLNDLVTFCVKGLPAGAIA